MVGDKILDTHEVGRLDPRLQVDWRQHGIKLARRQESALWNETEEMDGYTNAQRSQNVPNMMRRQFQF